MEYRLMQKVMTIFWAILFVSIFLQSCGNSNPNERGYDPENNLAEESPPPLPPQKQIKWSNGNIYSYDYTETITKIDSSGNETQITVYKENPPDENNIICEKKICKWCSKEVYAENYEIEEYPNINWMRGQPDLSSIFGMFSVIFEGKEYYDLENNRVRTEWRINCNYSGPSGFCSLKCENDYKYR